MSGTFTPQWVDFLRRMDLECEEIDGAKIGIGMGVWPLLYNFGSTKGMVILDSHAELPSDTMDVLCSAKYGSSFIEPPIVYDTESVEDMKEVLREWGWAGRTEDKPYWV